MYVASMDIKTALDVARPKHISQNMETIMFTVGFTAALLREMAGLEGQATFEKCEDHFPM